ncbi:MAG: hypothetical protein QNJ65_10565 [Xenococcaceae cyanobacterium MO_234.B1]|nr:hypothetical protein [Xenococcaceae cyanobacterium MO_234.B1]
MKKSVMEEKNPKISLAVRHKFLILLLLTLALMFDIVVRQPSSKLLDRQSLPEMPAAR